MNMSELFPQFKQFLESEVLDKNFDYIVPIETKGALVLDEIISTMEKPKPRVLYKRAFDFLDPEEIKGKKAAIIDDSVFTGKTINKDTENLLNKGFGEVKKYAFILFDGKDTKECRRIDGINFSTILKREQYENLIEEFSQLSLKFRPSNPDHLLFAAYLPEENSSDILFDISRYTGFLVEYQRQPGCCTWSVHYPDWSPEINKKIARDICSNKVRINIDSIGHMVRFSAQFYPSLSISSDLTINDPIWKKCHEILSKPWQDEETNIKNLYESFTIYIRLKQAKNFISEIQNAGVTVDSPRMLTARIGQYYGDQVAAELKKLWRNVAEESKQEERSASIESGYRNIKYPDDIQELMKQIMVILDSDYRKENESQENQYLWESVGRDLDEIASKPGLSKLEVSIGAEILNDYGYCSPMFDLRQSNGMKEAKRSYRMSETGTFRLYL